jgi:hypothetical protein
MVFETIIGIGIVTGIIYAERLRSRARNLRKK